ncbi:MAG: hypothetical protein KTR25_07220 [Myxococcales bacterium]|nr:hypothetical protein [Myxococcales bacterium]
MIGPGREKSLLGRVPPGSSPLDLAKYLVNSGIRTYQYSCGQQAIACYPPSPKLRTNYVLRELNADVQARF